MTDNCNSAYLRAVEFLYELQWFGSRMGLETTARLAGLAGNPHANLRFIHVAGTNGKGSTCAMLESIYREAGFRVGLFTSPHLVSFRERIQINREWISTTDVVRLVERMRSLLTQFTPEGHPTFFETVTVMALLYFAEKQCDLVVWETGLGGRLDATNIVIPVVSVITNIQYDHQKWLGETLAGIATEKAGIIKDGIPVITGTTEPEAFEIISRTAAARKAKLWRVENLEDATREIGPLQPALPGEHQRLNAAVAVATVRVLQPVFPVAPSLLGHALGSVQWPGRFQRVTAPDGRQVVLDGAHNVAGAQALAVELRRTFPEDRLILIVGILQDKDWQNICETLAPLGCRILLVPVQNERTTAPALMIESCRAANRTAEVLCCSTLAEALSKTADAPLLLITGSLYLVGEAMELLGIAQDSSGSERGLNEWNSTGSLR
jgi:dihydrofolate synthase/folylpolyglutamate synthase